MVRGTTLLILLITVLLASIESFQSFRMGRKGTFAMLSRGFQAAKSTEFQYTGKLRPGKITPSLVVPPHIMRPEYAASGFPKGKGSLFLSRIPVQTPEDISRMRVAGKHAREVLDAAIRMVREGITTEDIDKLVFAETIARNCYPSPLNYSKYPKSCCTSLNEVICHGIPDSTVLKSGDIINIDVTVFHDGVHGDCSETVFVGEPDERARDLVVTTYEAWRAAIDICKPGVPYNEIGAVIEDIITPKGYSSAKEFCGHGIGRVFHDFPNVLHYRNNERLGVMAEGHTFTIEPMICTGSAKSIFWQDDWTATTVDGGLSAQFEHTLLITKDGVEELTGKLPTSPKFAWEK